MFHLCLSPRGNTGLNTPSQLKSLSEHTHPVAAPQRCYEHLKSLPFPSIHRAPPLLVFGSDMPRLLLPTQPVKAGPQGVPIAMCTSLGWALQGPSRLIPGSSHQLSCMHINSVSPYTEHLKNVERLWQINTLPYVSEKTASCSKQDQ